MDFIALLIIGLGIIFTTWKMKIEKKGGLIYFFLIYLSLLLYAVGINLWFYILHNHDFELPGVYFYDSINYGVLGIFYLEFFFIFYFLLYFLIFPFQDKKLNLKKKLYFLGRDFIILFSVFCFFWGYNDVVGKYMKYHDWYLSEENFGGEEFICMDDSVTLLLEQNYRHPVIVNPYKNFFEFYKNYGKPQKTGIILTNKLQKKLVTETFLSTCRNINGENYYDKYMKIHGKKPYFKHIEYKINYKYFLDDSQLEIILVKLKNREYYINNLIKYSYQEFDLDLTIDEYDDQYGSKDKIEKFSDEKRKLLLSEYKDWTKNNYFDSIPEFHEQIKGKGSDIYTGEKYGIQEWFYDKLLNESGGWIDFFINESDTFITTKTSLYKGTELIFKNKDLYIGTSGPFNRLGYMGGLFTFEFNYFNTENNQEFQEKKCGEILEFGNNIYNQCHIIYNEDKYLATEYFCKDVKLLTGFKVYKPCEILKNHSISSNVWYGGELLNQNHDILESKNIFEYNDKIGFIARSSEGYFIMFNGVQVSEIFSGIRTKSCCMIFQYPFTIYENGVLEYVFEREEKLFIAFIELN